MNIRLAAVAVAALLALGASARAQGICVTCSQPNGAYACDIDGWDKLENLRKGTRMAQIACITDIAKRYGHGECRVRQGMVGPCMGHRHLVSLKAAPASPPQGVATAPLPPANVKPRPPGPAPQNQPPRTVVEMAGNAAKDTGKQLEKAGEAVEKTGKAVGGAVSKTWRCITSLFSDC